METIGVLYDRVKNILLLQPDCGQSCRKKNRSAFFFLTHHGEFITRKVSYNTNSKSFQPLSFLQHSQSSTRTRLIVETRSKSSEPASTTSAARPTKRPHKPLHLPESPDTEPSGQKKPLPSTKALKESSKPKQVSQAMDGKISCPWKRKKTGESCKKALDATANQYQCNIAALNGCHGPYDDSKSLADAESITHNDQKSVHDGRSE